MTGKLDEALDRMLNERARGQLRHLLTMIGPLVASRGVEAEANWQIGVGIFMALLGVVDSWRRK